MLHPEERRALRQRLGLPADRKVILSVGWIRKAHKRMDYVIEEVARLAGPRPYLQLLGAVDDGSTEVITLGRQLLGKAGFSARSVSYDQVFDFYQAADCFVLGSLGEGFGRVYLEALMHGLPVIAHDGPVMRYVLGGHGLFADLSRTGALAGLISEELKKYADPVLMRRRWAAVRDRFSWPILAASYREMFQICAWGVTKQMGGKLLAERGQCRETTSERSLK
jgi:glycosyltransferase involved in cell wall biosynthesis